MMEKASKQARGEPWGVAGRKVAASEQEQRRIQKISPVQTTSTTSSTSHWESWQNLVAFWILGFINNVGYVIMIAGAQEISSGSVGLVYFCGIFPSLVVNLTGPYWYDYVSYRDRMLLGAFCLLASFVLVALGSNSLFWQLLGVVLSGVQSGLGESSFVGLASFYDSQQCLTFWASGTGLAGPGGYTWIAVLHLALSFSFRTTLMLAAAVFPLLQVVTFTLMLETLRLPRPKRWWKSSIDGHELDDTTVSSSTPLLSSTCTARSAPSLNLASSSGVKSFESPWRARAVKPKLEDSVSVEIKSQSNVNDDNKSSHQLTAREKFRFICTLGPYMIPLAIVYFAEYTMQTGVWTAIGFPVEDPHARQVFYSQAGIAYQAGVFLSRSSGILFQATRIVLFLMPVLQMLLLVVFTLVSATHVSILYNWPVLTILCFGAGLLGGGVYVNSYTLISKEIRANRVELALSAACVANYFGIALADVAGILLQGCLFFINQLPGASVPLTC